MPEWGFVEHFGGWEKKGTRKEDSREVIAGRRFPGWDRVSGETRQRSQLLVQGALRSSACSERCPWV